MHFSKFKKTHDGIVGWCFIGSISFRVKINLLLDPFFEGKNGLWGQFSRNFGLFWV